MNNYFEFNEKELIVVKIVLQALKTKRAHLCFPFTVCTDVLSALH